MKKTSLFLFLGFLSYCTLGMIDYETQSFYDLFSRENWGALPVFTIAFAAIYFGLYSISKFAFSKLNT